MNRSDIKLQYVLTTPTDFDKEKEQLPLIVFLHGAGERGDDTEIVKHWGVPKVFSADPDYRGLRVITLSPQCPKGIIWSQIPLEVMKLIEDIAFRYNVDHHRISLTGMSMGGFGTWELGALYPYYFSALGPVCGKGYGGYADRLAKTPIWAFHGDMDPVVDVWGTVEMTEAVKKAGGEVRYTEYPGVGHESWINAYEQDDLIPWLAAQVRKDREE